MTNEAKRSEESGLTVGLGLRIIERDGVLVGIRDKGGFLIFFPSITKYQDQDERYIEECEQQKRLADFLLSALENA